MRPDPLTLPVGASLRPANSIEVTASLQAAGRAIGHCNHALTVVRDGRYAGVLGQRELSRAAAQGASLDQSIELHLSSAPGIPATFSGAEALRALLDQDAEMLAVLDERSCVLGVISPSDLILGCDGQFASLRPRMVGGMATHFGVYLTNGAVSGGVSSLALLTTGMTLFGLHVLATLAAVSAERLVISLTVPSGVVDALFGPVTLLVFMLSLRALPLAGVHAAEHMTVHAIERGEELRPEIVGRMPRVHPRCGTNLFAGALILLTLTQWHFIEEESLRVLIALLATLFFWRRLGSLLQRFVTTKPPTPKQIEMGIRAGRELMDRYQSAPIASPPLWRRIWTSGLLQILAGSYLMLGLLYLLSKATAYPDLLQVYLGR